MRRIMLVLLVFVGCRTSKCKHGYGEYVASYRVYNSDSFYPVFGINTIFPKMYVHVCDSTVVHYTYNNNFQNFKQVKKCDTSTP